MKATVGQIKEAISYDNEMLEKYPNKEVLYFLGDNTRRERILNKLGSIVFYAFCEIKNAYGCFDIYKLLINKEIPDDIVQFYVDTKNGGCYELDLIYFIYGIGNSTHKSLTDVRNDMLEMYKGSAKQVNDVFKGRIIKPSLNDILHDLSVNGESSVFYKQLQA